MDVRSFVRIGRLTAGPAGRAFEYKCEGDPISRRSTAKLCHTFAKDEHGCRCETRGPLGLRLNEIIHLACFRTKSTIGFGSFKLWG